MTAVKNGVGSLLSRHSKLSPAIQITPARARPQTAKKQLPPVDPLLLSQQIWGEGCLFPGGVELGLDLVKPFAVDSSMTLCDLTAGLGGPSRKVAVDCDVYITGLEQSPAIAARGHALSVIAKLEKKLPITAYTPSALKLKPRMFNGIYGHLLTWSVPDKHKLFKEIKQGLKPQGGFHFTDFVIDAEQPDASILLRLLKKEPMAVSPWSTVEMKAALKEAGLQCRVSDDMTDRFVGQVLEGWSSFIKAAKLKSRPTKELAAILDEAEIWCLRLTALRSGAISYARFYATTIT